MEFKQKIIVLFLSIWFTCCMHSQNIEKELPLQIVNSSRVKNDLSIITTSKTPRNYRNIAALNRVANYIKEEFDKVCDSVDFQEYKVENNIYKNVIGSIGTENKERIIIGAHYDVAGNSDGADDNASGVAGLLELARLLSKEELTYRIDFVAYSLEEPPFFRTQYMGSYVHAKYIHDSKISIKGMISLESIGFYSDAPDSQEYPIVEMELIYGNKGNFITVVQHQNSNDFSDQVAQQMKEQQLISTKSFKGTSLVQGIDFSDHLNYWKFNYDAVMITNTAFFRNKNYHTANDTMETLDVQKMCDVIEQVYQTIKALK